MEAGCVHDAAKSSVPMPQRRFLYMRVCEVWFWGGMVFGTYCAAAAATRGLVVTVDHCLPAASTVLAARCLVQLQEENSPQHYNTVTVPGVHSQNCSQLLLLQRLRSYLRA